MKDAKKTSLRLPSKVAGAHWLTERQCPECGKGFCVPAIDDWVYKAGDLALCSWHCLRAREQRLGKKTARHTVSMSGRVRVTKEQVQQMIRMVDSGESLAEVGRVFGVSGEVVGYHVHKREKEGLTGAGEVGQGRTEIPIGEDVQLGDV